MNKRVKQLVGVLLAVLVLSALTVSALAVENTDEYTVTVSVGNVAGAQLSGQSSWTKKAGEWVDFGTVTLPDTSPYYFKGFRPAGKDNNVVYASSIPVEEDADYVAAYGLQGELVAYTVNYVIAGTDTQLRPSQTYYGNVGDKSVVAYLNIDGYQPQALNLAKTLVEDESQNVFNFEYTEIVVPTPVPAEPAPTPVVYEEPAAGGEAGGAAAAGGEAAGGEEEIAPAPAPAGEGAAGGETAGTEGSNVPEGQGPAALPEPEQQAQEPVDITGDDTPLNNGPAEIIDLDDTPSGEKPEIKEKPQTEIQQERAQKETMLYVSVGLLGVALIAIAALVVLLVRRRGVKR